jgi:hypothetical protein
MMFGSYTCPVRLVVRCLHVEWQTKAITAKYMKTKSKLAFTEAEVRAVKAPYHSCLSSPT